MRLGLIVVLLIPWPQDDSKKREKDIADWIAQLDDSDPETRDRAQEALIKIGAPALDALKKAMQSSSAEVRSRAERAHGVIRWKSSERDYAKALSEEQKNLVEKYEAKDWATTVQEKLSRAFQGPISAPALEKTELPKDPIWGLIDQTWLAKPAIFRSGSEIFEYWRIVSDKFIFWVTIPKKSEYPRFYVLEPRESRFELTPESIEWKAEKGGHQIPALTKVLGGPRFADVDGGSIKRLEERGKLTAVVYGFHWDEDKPQAKLRYLFLTERFIILCLAFQL